MNIKDIVEKQRQQEEVALMQYEKVLRYCGATVVQAHKEYIDEIKRTQIEAKAAIQELMK